jgi:DcuC family C4-dicarboxylate transporter
MIELLIGTLVTLAVGRYIFKGYSATGVLLSGGLLLLAITALMGKAVLPASVPPPATWPPTSSNTCASCWSTGGGLGMLIMVLCGFAGYMSHIGANTILVKLASKPSVSSSPPTSCWWPPIWSPAPCRWR